MAEKEIQPRPKTAPVTVFGWFMLIVGSLSVLMFGGLGALLAVARKEADGELFPAEDLAELPPAMLMYVEHLNAILILFFISSLLLLLAGLGIIKRKEWGRQLGVFLLAVSILTSVVSTVAGLQGANPAGLALVLLNIGLAVLTTVLHGWLIWKLRTSEIRGEFVEPRPESPSP